MSSNACDLVVALWQSIGLTVLVVAFGIFFLWFWFIFLGKGDWSEYGLEDNPAISLTATVRSEDSRNSSTDLASQSPSSSTPAV